MLGCQPIISYNFGAKNYDRVKLTYKYILISTIVIGVLSTLLFELAPNLIVGMFGQPTNIPNPEDYWKFAEMTFRIFLSLVTFTCIIKMSSIFFQAVGKPVFAIISSLTRDIVCFVPLVILLPRFLEIEGILYAAPIADFIAMIVAVGITIYFMKSLKSEEVAETITVPKLHKSKKGAIITIAREHGSGGKQIGKLVAEKLSIPFYYKEITALAAEESGLHKAFISDINVNSPKLLHDLYLSTNVIQQAIIAQDQIIKKTANQGSCVIVGRAADYVLRNYSDVVRIFIYAPEDYRIKKVMDVYGDTQKEAEKNIQHSDEARANYYNNISGLQWGDAHNYDLLIDSSIGDEKCAEIICNFINNLNL